MTRRTYYVKEDFERTRLERTRGRRKMRDGKYAKQTQHNR
jgi:hypothetical protein